MSDLRLDGLGGITGAEWLASLSPDERQRIEAEHAASTNAAIARFEAMLAETGRIAARVAARGLAVRSPDLMGLVKDAHADNAALAEVAAGDCAPTVADLLDWWPDQAPATVRAEVETRFAVAMPADFLEMDADACEAIPSWRLGWKLTRPGDIAALHEAFCGPERLCPHPLVPLVEAWQDRPVEIKPFRPVNRASLPALNRRAEHPRLFDFPASAKPPPAPLQMSLFDIEPPPHCPSWLLQMFDMAGGITNEKGRGAPWPMRLFVSAFLHLPIGQRDFNWRTLRFSQEEVIGWLHPDGWANRRRDWHRLPEALQHMKREMGWVSVPGIGSAALIMPSVIPESPNDPGIEFTIRLPKAAAHGARIDWPTLQRYGNESARNYRAYLAVSEWLHLSARAGQPITQEIAPPILNKDGKPIRRKGGRIVRDKSRRVPNPAERYLRPLSDADLAAMIGVDGGDKRRRHDARKSFDTLNADGVIDLQREGKLCRIFGPPPDGE